MTATKTKPKFRKVWVVLCPDCSEYYSDSEGDVAFDFSERKIRSQLKSRELRCYCDG